VIDSDFRKEKSVLGGRGLQVSGILKMFQSITATRHIIICVDARDECRPEHRIVLLELFGQILWESLNIHLFTTERPHVQGEVVKELGRGATLLFRQATEEGVLRLLCEKFRKDIVSTMISDTLKGDEVKSIPAISSETYVALRSRAALL